MVGDLVKQHVDAIVNAANSSLLGGGGVDGAIRRAGGPRILAECRELRRTTLPDGLPTGRAAITTGGDLVARHVIHTVGPIYGRHRGAEADLLASCYRSSLELAAAHGLGSLAFPAISTGAFGYPPLEAGRIAAGTVANFLARSKTPSEVRLVFFQQSDADRLLGDEEFRSSLGLDGDEEIGSND
jgi:O-acetyl-ADP-ribose deacetylase (regulator of RNase III)